MHPDGMRVITFTSPGGVQSLLDQIGEVPLPPYIHAPLRRPEDYQTVYATTEGAIAAPTAGLHFTTELLSQIRAQGVSVVTLTMHIGLGTFKPVTTEVVERHRMGSEWYSVSASAASEINTVRKGGGRFGAVGPSPVRTFEPVAYDDGTLRAGEGESDLFIYPGFRFKTTDMLVTNFHLPKTTLMLLVCAFAGRDRILRAYADATRLRYRFYSFGDAMLIL
jgi:S-adenosylmethionine:tRNA ribosyltransferase-isomerase